MTDLPFGRLIFSSIPKTNFNFQFNGKGLSPRTLRDLQATYFSHPVAAFYSSVIACD